jgi:hypothetical protein
VLPSSFDRVATQLNDVPERSLRSVITTTFEGLTSGDEFLRILSFLLSLLKFTVFMVYQLIVKVL